jgi:hypothetical protein
MSQSYIDPRTGFTITSNSDTWTVDHKQLPHGETPPPALPTAEQLKDFQFWLANKSAIQDAANRGLFNN